MSLEDADERGVRKVDDDGELTDAGRYLFDLQGYLVLEDVLEGAEVAELNRLIDEQDLPEPPKDSGSARFGREFLEWGQPFCDLLDHEQIVPVLRELLGEGFRLDHQYGIYLRKGTGSLNLHGGGTPYDPPEYFHFENGGMINGLTVVSWNLRDTGPEHGGFCCLPGSHKANYPLPDGIAEEHATAEDLESVPRKVVVPEAPAGSVTIFTEALTHGTAPWVADHQRRSLLYKYSPAQQSWSGRYPEPPEGVELTERQEKLFEPPYFNDHPSLEDDTPR